MRIGGLQRSSLIDYPGHVGAIVFAIGCNFRCPYCHNPELVDETAPELAEEEVLDFLARRAGTLEAVTITGGEPTVQPDLERFIERVKALGYLVKLDTNGTSPEQLRTLIARERVDYVAMDVKAPLASYAATVGRPVDTCAIKASIDLLIEGAIPYEFRTTIVKALLSPHDLRAIGEDIAGARRWALQKFVPTKLLNPAFVRKTTYSDAEFDALRALAEEYVDECIVR